MREAGGEAAEHRHLLHLDRRAQRIALAGGHAVEGAGERGQLVLALIDDAGAKLALRQRRRSVHEPGNAAVEPLAEQGDEPRHQQADDQRGGDQDLSDIAERAHIAGRFIGQRDGPAGQDLLLARDLDRLLDRPSDGGERDILRRQQHRLDDAARIVAAQQLGQRGQAHMQGDRDFPGAVPPRKGRQLAHHQEGAGPCIIGQERADHRAARQVGARHFGDEWLPGAAPIGLSGGRLAGDGMDQPVLGVEHQDAVEVGIVGLIFEHRAHAGGRDTFFQRQGERQVGIGRQRVELRKAAFEEAGEAPLRGGEALAGVAAREHIEQAAGIAVIGEQHHRQRQHGHGDHRGGIANGNMRKPWDAHAPNIVEAGRLVQRVECGGCAERLQSGLHTTRRYLFPASSRTADRPKPGIAV